MTKFVPHPGYTTTNWVEFVSVLFLIAGFIFSLTTGSAMMYYIVAFLTGTFFGRVWYKTKHSLQFKYILMMTFFMIGFIVGNMISRYGDPKITIFTFLVGIILSYYLHKKKLIEGIDF